MLAVHTSKGKQKGHNNDFFQRHCCVLCLLCKAVDGLSRAAL